MNKVFLFVVFCGISSAVHAQQKQASELGNIALSVFISEKIELTEDARNSLKTKLLQTIINNGLAESSFNSRFIITVSVSVGSKDIVAGPPQMIAQNLGLTFFIGDAFDNKIYSSVEIAVKGVGTNENKSFIDAIKNINPKRKELVTLVEQGKNKIISYYNNQCEQILSDAVSLAQKEKYDEAIYNLSLVPSACTSCYAKCSDKINELYLARLNQNGKKNLSEANAIWAASGNLDGAGRAIDLLSKIHIDASSKKEAENLIAQISAKLQADEKRDWELKLKQYEDAQKMEQQRMKMMEESDIRNSQLENERLNAARQVALEYARNQPKTITYNNIYWR